MKAKADTGTKAQYLSIFTCWLTYVFIYLARYSYSANIALIEADYHVSHASAGLVITFFSIAYGVGQVIHGLFCCRYPKRYIVSAALLVCAGMDLLLFFGVPFYLIKYLWFLNALCQSLLWPTLMQTISENVSDRLIKTGVLAMSTTTPIGTFVAYGLSAALAEINYRLSFLVGTVVLTGISFIWFFLYRQGNYLRTADSADTAASNRFSAVLLVPIGLLLVFSIVTNFAKDGLQTWVPVILKSMRPELGDGFSILLTLVLPLFGIFGATVAVMLNKKIPKAIPLTVFFLSVTALFSFIVLSFQGNLPVMVISFGILELLLHGSSNVIVSIFPLAMRSRMSSGTLTGVLNGSAYIGSAASSYLLGRIADVSGWSAVFVTLCGVVCSAVLLGAIYLALSHRKPEINV